MRLAAFGLFLLPLSLAAQQTPESMLADSNVTAEQMDRMMHYQQGPVVLKDGLATLNVPEGFRYLDPDQSEFIIVKAWGNPPRDKTLGMLFPSDVSPFTREGWGVVITFDEDGYVKDDDAEKIDYAKLLKDMQEGTAEESQKRVKDGYDAIRLVGWGEQPHYDQASHKLYWAQELEFGANPAHTLNYNIRVLGRRGVLVLNAVAGMDQLETVKSSMGQVLGFVDFNEGHRYADFKPEADKVAAYGIGALVAGGIAAKAGLFKVLIAGILAAKKLLVAAVVGVGAWFKARMGKKKSAPTNA
ncbi:MAG TPA: DUF2167 domain-containing protein [Gemmatimonadales bacterium]|nr:DUF2167 domain-containing protein [Gemmatimonadales bacterium]